MERDSIFNYVPGQINVDLWPGSSWKEQDVADLSDVMRTFGEVSGQRSYNLRGMGLHTGLAFAAGAVASAFFAAFGKDLYNIAKAKIIDVLFRPYKNRDRVDLAPADEDELDLGGDYLFFEIEDKHTRTNVYIAGVYDSETELAEMLDGCAQVFNLVWRAVKNGEHPCVFSESHFVRADWRPTGAGPTWELEVHLKLARNRRGEAITEASHRCLVAQKSLVDGCWSTLPWSVFDPLKRHAAFEDDEL